MLKSITSLFNSGTFQTVSATVATISSGLVWLLQKLGCTATATDSLICLESNIPSWVPESFVPTLMPWLVIAATLSGFLTIAARFVKGTAFTPSAPISSSGAPGTVTQAQVNSGPKK